MKRVVIPFFLFFIIATSISALWEQFQSDDFNSGKANGTGYFNSKEITNFTDSLNGMNFQPLVSDVDNNGKNEIIIFSGNYLKILDARLNLIDEKFVGALLGQPAVFNIDEDNFKEIIFISNFSGINYFFAYGYNNTDFNYEFNFTITNGGVGSGIKCTALGSTNICVFMDNAQYVHIVNLTSKTDSSYNTSAYTDTQEKVPAIGDLHNNGNLQAVFWFDKDNNNQYGLMAFDLLSRNFDSGFNNNGIVDDVVNPYDTRFVLKGHPVLVDLNTDGKLEIAVSAYYDDECTYWYCNDRFTELFVYNNSGDELFSVCAGGYYYCNDGSSQEVWWEGTNPFILDSDNNGVSDICFIKDKKINNYFKNMTINCYNYSGSRILDSEIGLGVIKTATIADMNNDGILDIITENNIYYKNGSSFYSHNFGSNSAIPADIDGNEGLDLLFSKKSLTQIFIDDSNIVEVSNVSISPLIASSEDSLSCSFIATGNGNLKANVSWHKNNILYSTESNIQCNNGSICSALNPIPSSSISKNEEWKCSVVAFNESFSSYTVNDEAEILGKTSEWAGYCNNGNNLCGQSGISYFSNAGAESISNNSEGMEFEPLTADINNDGKNEIIIFSNSKLIIFNQSLGLINEKNIGNLVGQPTVYNIDDDNNLEIIFNANVSSSSYLMAFEYNNNFNKQCNLSISNGLSGAGIKCADVANTKSCFFKDQKNVFYNVNMSNNCTQTASLITNNHDDTTLTVSSILDYDNDGKLEGLWWFNNDSDAYKGIAVIELETMDFDAGFNEIGFIDDVTQGSGYDYRAGFEHLKANPVFYQSDNGGGYEILISYDNEKIAGMVYDEFQCYRSVLKSYDTDGTLLWTIRPETCNPGTGTYYCDMSTPVIADVDANGYEDICFLMNGDSPCYTGSYLTSTNDYFFCIDRFGNNVENYPKNTLDIEKYASYSTNIDTPMYLADMDNDNELEMIGSGFIWDLNGSILKGNYSSFTKFAPIPVDVDKNGVLELVGSKVNETDVFYANVDVCSGRIQAISVDSENNEVPSTNFYANDILKGTTDSNGLFETQVSNICGQTITYSLKCSNNSLNCGTETKSIDFDNDFDSLIFDCSICTGNSDLKITLGNVNISKENNKVTINITVVNVAVNNANLTVKAQDKDTGLISNESSILFNVNAGDRFSSQALSLNLDNADFVHIYVDPDEKVMETYEDNNYVVVPVITNKRKAFISVDTGNSYVDNAIKDYLSLFVIPTSDDDSSLTIAVGLGEHNSLINSKKAYTKDNFKWYVDGNSVYHNNNPIGSMPWVGLVGAFRENTGGDDYVFAMGKEIEGVVAAAKRLVNARDKFFVPQLFNSYTSVIGDTDTLGISVFDIMHNDENNNKFNKQRNTEFQKVVENILEDNNFEVAIKIVKTVNDNTTLRVKNLKSDFSAEFRDAVVNDSRPIVFSGGLWNNLFYWEDNKPLMDKFMGKGRDLWEIEITGGPEQDAKQNSPNYNYNTTRDYYWPALIAGVQQYSGENSLQYVGHSNGCGVALASLNSYSASGKDNAGYYFDVSTGQYLFMDLSSNPVDTFVGMGCPGALDGYSPFYKYFGMFGDKIVSQINTNHVTAKEVSQKLLALCKSELDGDEEEYCVLAAKGLDKVDGDFKVSKNLLIDYLNNVKDTSNEPQVEQGLAIRKFRLYANNDFSKSYRAKIILGLGGRFDTNQLKHDIVVSQQDSQGISDRIIATNPVKLINYTNFYHGRNDFKDFMDNLEVFLNEDQK